MEKFKKFLKNSIVTEAIKYHLDNKISLSECQFRYGSEMFFEFFNNLKTLYKNNSLQEEFLDEDLIEILESDLGEFDFYEGEQVPLDFIFEEDNEGKSLGKIHRGGSKEFYVYVKDKSTGNVKKVSFGDKGLSNKYDNPERKKAFAARHKCSEKTDRTTPGYWACRVNKYLGKSSAAKSGYW